MRGKYSFCLHKFKKRTKLNETGETPEAIWRESLAATIQAGHEAPGPVFGGHMGHGSPEGVGSAETGGGKTGQIVMMDRDIRMMNRGLIPINWWQTLFTSSGRYQIDTRHGSVAHSFNRSQLVSRWKAKLHTVWERFFPRNSHNILNGCLCFWFLLYDNVRTKKSNEMRQIKAWDNRLPYKNFELINCSILQVAGKNPIKIVWIGPCIQRKKNLRRRTTTTRLTMNAGGWVN